MQIDLSEIVGKGGVVLAGMERGTAARDLFTLDAHDASGEEIVVTAPESLEAISPSFVQGFLAGSLSKLGEGRLREKYRFELNELLQEDISEGIRRLLMKRKIAGLD
ncbi:hypothetical protein [Hasllibacter sp. MH4015]|uniref:hypothetical protein n=1 Tax=Hasllibacter sp. MH4015 TaxID=2854029 RepID=UPI001CD4BC59|nr:hypothetical protein [Hasllibacter sp. MH4015]